MAETKHATLKYTALRLGIFAICLVVLTALSWFGLIPVGVGSSNSLWLFGLAILVSAPISYVVLNRYRDAMAQQVGTAVSGRLGRAKEKLNANRSMEDDADDTARSSGGA